jgi:transposase InsO family protein
MPWKTSSAMSERVQLICEHINGVGLSITDLARSYEVSRKTVYKWLAKYEAGSWDGLKDSSRAAHHHPNAVSEQIINKVLELRAQHPLWGAPKLRQKLLEIYGGERCPAESTVGQILKRHGLARLLRRPHHATPSREPLRHAQAPNEVWTIDLKGEFSLGDAMRCSPLTVCDAFSRYFLLCQAYARPPAFDSVQSSLIRLFKEFGMPDAMRSDNGTPFASCGLGGLTQLSVWWVRLGIRLERIEPGHPEQNGRHERAHRTLKEATAQPARENLPAQQQAFDEFLREYNQDRPHEALRQKTPASVYIPSRRVYTARLPDPREYPPGWPKRRVSANGDISYRGQSIRINQALWNQHVGLKPVGEGLWAVYFEHLEMGIYDEREGKIKPLPRLRDPKPIHEDYTI